MIPRTGERFRPFAVTLAWAVVAATGIALLAVVFGPHRVGDYYTETDFYGGYGPGARLIQRGVFDASRYGVQGPGFEVALALIGFAVRDLFVAGELIAAASAVAALALWFALLRGRVGLAAAAWTTALLAANGTLFRYGYSATADAMALALQAGALYFALARDRPRSLLAGICLALAAMTRYTAVALLPVLLLAPVFAPRSPARSRARESLLLLIGFVAATLPFLLASMAQKHVPGELLFHNVAYDAFATARGRTLADYQTGAQAQLHSLSQAIARDPMAIVRRELTNLYRHVIGDARDLVGWPVAALGALGLALLAAERRWRIVGPLALGGAALYLALVPAPASARYSLVLLPFYLSLAGIALGSPGLPFATWRGRLAPLAGTALIALSLVSSVRMQRDELALLPVETLDIARELRRVPAPERRVMAVKPHLAWLADAEFVPLPQVASLEALATAGRAAGARYLFMSWIEANNRPTLWFLLDPSHPVSGLTAVATTEHPGSVLYRIDPGFGPSPAWLADDAQRRASAQRVLAGMPAPLIGRTHLTLAISARGENHFAEVREHALAAIAIDPRQEYAWRLLGDSQIVSGDRDGAIASFVRAVALAPDDIDARVALGWMQLGAGNAAAAADAWRPAVDATTDQRTLERMVALFRERGEESVAAKAAAVEARLQR